MDQHFTIRITQIDGTVLTYNMMIPIISQLEEEHTFDFNHSFTSIKEIKITSNNIQFKNFFYITNYSIKLSVRNSTHQYTYARRNTEGYLYVHRVSRSCNYWYILCGK